MNDELAVVLPSPLIIAMSDADGGDVGLRLDSLSPTETITDKTGLATAVAVYEFDLRPHTQRSSLPLCP